MRVPTRHRHATPSAPRESASVLGLLAATAVLTGSLLAAAPSVADGDRFVFPAKVTTTHGRIFTLEDLGHEYDTGSFVIFDGETEGRVSWRDLDRVTFAGNLGHAPDALGPRQPGTRRVRLHYVDGQERIVNMSVGRVWGHDGTGERSVRADNLALIDFDEARIAPRLYKACERGHVWEQEAYRYCPYDGLELTAWRAR